MSPTPDRSAGSRRSGPGPRGSATSSDSSAATGGCRRWRRCARVGLGSQPRPWSAPDAAHGARRLAEAALGHVVLELFAPDRAADHLLELVVAGAGPHGGAQVRLVHAEQA